MVEIVICRDRSAGLFWDALSTALEQVPRFRVTAVADESDIVPAIRDRRASLLICSVEPDFSHRELFREFPSLAIVRVDEDSARTVLRTSQSVPVETRVSLDDPDYQLFVELITRMFPPDEEADKLTLRLLDTSGPEPEPDEPLDPGPPAFPDEGEAAQHAAAEQWIEALLSERLQELVDGEANTAGRVTGWGLSARDAMELFATDAKRSDRNRLPDLEDRVFWTPGEPAHGRFQWLAKVFSLSLLEQQLLMLTLAPEVDGRFGRIFGCLNDDMTRRRACLAMFAELPRFRNDGRRKLMSVVYGESPLRTYGLLVGGDDGLPLSEAAVRVPGDVLNFATGNTGEQPAGVSRLHLPPDDPRPQGRSTKVLRARLRRWLQRARRDGVAPTLNIDAGPDARTWFVRGAGEVGLRVVDVDLKKLSEMPLMDAYTELLHAARTAMLHSAALLITNPSAASSANDIESLAVDVIGSRVTLMAIVGRFHGVVHVRSMSRLARRDLDAGDRADVWLDYAERLGVDLSDQYAAELGAWAKFTEADIEQTLYFARDKVMDIHLFKKAARHVSTTGVPSSVRRLAANFDWEDIVLPKGVSEQLRRIPDHVTYRERVLGEWGYRSRMSYGLGTACLFSGPSGTGKTMASQVIARAVGDAEIFQCDLAKTVSKYIGESEKNLDAIFEAAEKSRAVLVFDEADVLFGKRTEIRDAHDRYANLEVGYLLQRMEAYEGLVILTTNSRSSMDTSFLRRLRFIVEFPVPSPLEREKIWQRVFPDDLPRADDVELDYLVQQFDLTGGHIQQVAIMAAYAAAAEQCSKIHMRHINAATCDELRKLGMDSARRDFEELLRRPEPSAA